MHTENPQERRQHNNRRRYDKRQNIFFKTNLVAWLALVASLGTALAFFDRLHEDYVTREELYKMILDERGQHHGPAGETIFFPDWQKVVNSPVTGTGETHGQHN